MSASSLVAVVMLNYNGLDDTRKALRSIEGITAVSLWPIVIDNGSTIDEAAVLRVEFPKVDIERIEVNVGFARGINLGATYALRGGASHILVFDNGASMEDGGALIKGLLNALATDPNIVAAGPVVVDDVETLSLQSAGYQYSLWWPVPRVGRVKRSKSPPPTFISGCCMLVPADRYAELGGFDPDYYLYGDDVDFALRARALGYRVVVVLDVSVRHRRAASDRLRSNRYVYTALRSNLILIRKHAKWYQVPSAAVASIAISSGLVVYAMFCGNRNAVFAVLRAWLDFASGRWGGYDGSVLTATTRPSTGDLAVASAFAQTV